MSRWLLRLALAAVVLIVGWWMWERWLVPDETRIRQLIAQMEDSLIRQNFLRLADAVAQDYRDDFGLDKSTLLMAARTFRDRYDELRIETPELKVIVADDHRTAHAAMLVSVGGRLKSGASPEPDADRVTLFFHKTDDGWKLDRIEAPGFRPG